jgi:6-phosphogluconolactonase
MIHIFNTFDDLSQHTAETIYANGLKAIHNQNVFHLVLSGGNTPKKVYEKLAEQLHMERDFWMKTHVYWGDERCVPPIDPQSNFRMANHALLFQIPILSENIHRIKAELSDHQSIIQQYETKFPKHPDLVLLGMGEDGHIASLFPKSPVLDITNRYFSESVGDIEPIYRITMTPVAIRGAQDIIILVSGKNKAEALARVFQKKGYVSETPARLVRDRTWFVDKDAAAPILKMKHLENEIRFHK